MMKNRLCSFTDGMALGTRLHQLLCGAWGEREIRTRKIGSGCFMLFRKSSWAHQSSISEP